MKWLLVVAAFVALVADAEAGRRWSNYSYRRPVPDRRTYYPDPHWPGPSHFPIGGGGGRRLSPIIPWR